MKLIKSSDYRTMPWKNGQGQTAEIEIFPANAHFAENDFIWRLSSAPIKTSGPFSMFPGFDRILTVWKGDGLIINGRHHGPLAPFSFSGEVPIDCAPDGDGVTDLGLIYRRDRVQASMELKMFAGHPMAKKLVLAEGVHFLVCMKGSFQVGDLSLEAGDTIKIDVAETIHVLSPHGATCIHVHIHRF